ncbi:MAG TPA: DUF2934 domain-containing protein [Gallionella sp.]|nr:DUF2934 domain-containing protein [Gallionella sp.]
MAQQKAKPLTKKASSAGLGSVADVKPKATKVTTTAVAKKASIKKSTTPTTKKTAAPIPKKEAPTKKAATTINSELATKKTATKPTPEERYRMVQTAAYFIAERTGFGGSALEHWAAAEREIAGKLG